MALLWLTGVGLALALPLAVEAGYRLHRWSLRSARTEGDDGWAAMLAGAVTLLALLLGFTVAMATDRYEARRRLVIDEANAISTTYLRAQAFQEPAGKILRTALLHYAEGRQRAYLAGDDPAKIAAVERAADLQRTQIWAATLAALRQPEGPAMTMASLQATNDMFDIAAARQATLEARVPPPILLSLIAYAIVTAGLSGYGLGAYGVRHGVASTLLFLMVAVLITLIVDLDRPRSGGIRVSQSPLERVATSIATAEAHSRVP